MKAVILFLVVTFVSSHYAIASEPLDRVQGVSTPVIIDVRNRSEWDQGHHPEAKHIEWQNIVSRVEAMQLNKETPIVLYCRSGNRAGKAKNLLESAGYSKVINGINLHHLTIE